MNVADSELVAGILKNNNYKITDDYQQADLILINTCAVRENAEQRVFGRIGLFTHQKQINKNLVVGLIGCVAQRLKDKLLNDFKTIDFVAGPDTYRRLPDLIEKVKQGERPLDVILSKQENYDDLEPYYYDKNKITGFVSITRGCDNMCAFCIVPFTRGRERSRSPENILSEIQTMKKDGFKEITLLGQNVDKYNWNDGKMKFANLLEKVAVEFPELRIRFATSYPQDMTDDVLKVIAKYKNVCKYIHLPVQAGSNAVLERMKRGYTREWYLNRIEAIKRIIPECSISTDIIAGFCGETEENHKQTIDLMRQVEFDYAYMFKYSVRPNTFAARNLADDVPEDVKSRRLKEIIDLQNNLSYQSNKNDVGKIFEVLVEEISKKNDKQVFGRNSQNKVIIFNGDESLKGTCVNVKVTGFTQATLFGEIC